MMDCAQYRRAILADPQADDADLRAHLASCPECTEYTVRVRRFEDRLGRALRVAVPSPEDGVVVPLRAPRGRAGQPWNADRRRWLAAAASVLLGTVVAGGLWLAAPGRTLAAAVVEHMAGEPDAWARTDVAVSPPTLDGVLTTSRVRLKADAGLVTYASSCAFRGHTVPHLVVQTTGGPVTVMVLTHEELRRSARFNEQGYRGVIVPVHGHGSLAVLVKGPQTDMKTVEGVAARVLAAIEWTD